MDDDFLVDELSLVVKGRTHPPNQSFAPYSNGGNREDYSSNNVAPATNLNRRMMEFQKTNWEFNGKNVDSSSSSKQHLSFRHMMNERLRREEEKEGYSSLLSMLPSDTKKNKNAIVTGATRRIEEIEGYKQMLERRIMDLQEAEEAQSSTLDRRVAKKKVKIKVVSTTSSGLEGSMLEVLYELKALGAEPTTIKSKISRQGFEAVMDVETQSDAEKKIVSGIPGCFVLES